MLRETQMKQRVPGVLCKHGSSLLPSEHRSVHRRAVRAYLCEIEGVLRVL